MLHYGNNTNDVWQFLQRWVLTPSKGLGKLPVHFTIFIYSPRTCYKLAEVRMLSSLSAST